MVLVKGRQLLPAKVSDKLQHCSSSLELLCQWFSTIFRPWRTLQLSFLHGYTLKLVTKTQLCETTSLQVLALIL